MRDSFVIGHDLSLWETWRAGLYNVLRARYIKNLSITFIAICVVMILLTLLSSGMNVPLIIGSLLPIIGIALALIVIFFVTVCFIYLAKPHLFKNASYLFNHWGVTRTNRKTEVATPWRQIRDVKENNRFFFLYFGLTDAHVMQKRMLADEQAVSELRDFFSEKIRNR